MKLLFLITLLFAGQAFAAGTVVKTIGGNVATKSSNYTVTNSDGLSYLTADTASGAVNITMPAPGSNIGRQITVEHKSGDTYNACLLFNNASDSVDGRVYTTEFCPNDGDKVTLAAFAANQWKVVSYFYGNGDGGRNYVINSSFLFAQRGTTTTNATSSFVYGLDRWRFNGQAGGTGSGQLTQNASSAGGIGVLPGSKNYATWQQSVAPTGGSLILSQPIEDVRILANKTVTVTLYAAADSARTFTILLIQTFGTGGSPSTSVVSSNCSVPVTTSFAKYSCTFYLPSISGKTFGSNDNSYTDLQIYSPANTTFSLYPAAITLNEGPIAAPFRLAGGTIGGEYNLATRYFERLLATQYVAFGTAHVEGSTLFYGTTRYAMKRATPTTITYGGTLQFNNSAIAGGTGNISSVTVYGKDAQSALLTGTVPSLTNSSGMFRCNTTNCYIDIDSEL